MDLPPLAAVSFHARDSAFYGWVALLVGRIILTPMRTHVDPSFPEATHRIPRRLLFALLGYVALYFAWQVSGIGFEREAVGDLIFVPPAALATITCWRAGGRSAAVPGMRWAWRLIALAIASFGLGNVIQMVYEVSTVEYPFPSFADLFYLGFYPLFFAGIMRFPWGIAGGRNRRAQAILDGITIAIGGGMIVWYMVLGPTAYSDTGSTLETLVSLGYPIGDLILIGGLAWLWVGSEASPLRRPLTLLSLALGFYVAGDLVYSWLLFNSAYAGGNWVDASWMLGTGAFVLAGACQPPLEEADASPVESGTSTSRLAVLPYLGAVVTFVLLIGSQAGDPFFPGLSLTLTAALVAALVLARQYLSQRELATANRELREAHAELAALATTDPLTGLPNHRALVDAMDSELDRAGRYERPCSFLFIDIDYFKALNDGCGHAGGDSVLRELGEVMKRALRKIDTLGRWGGEEFVVVLPEVDAEATMATAERLRSTVAKHIFGVASGTHLTVSVGAASYPRDGESRSTVLEAADRAMYAAKRMGRNQVFDAADPTVRALRDGEGSSDFDERATMGAVDALAMLVDNRDKGTGDHTTHVATLAERMALALGCSPKRAREVNLAAKLHDIGKVAVADSILRKPGRLTEEEWKLMRRHPAVGADVVSRVGRLAKLAPIIRSHHEHYDGGGYPAGLKGEEIPIEARIVGVADAFDAMISDRPYRNRIEIEQAREELRRCAGTQFDPQVVDALEGILDREVLHQEQDAA